MKTCVIRRAVPIRARGPKNGCPNDEVAADRENRCRKRTGEAGREGRFGDARERWLQGTQKVRRVSCSWIGKVRRRQEARNQSAPRHKSIQRRAYDVPGQAGTQDCKGPSRQGRQRRGVSGRTALREAWCS